MITPTAKSANKNAALSIGWAARIKDAVKRDPKRSWLLTILIAILLGIWGKMLFGGHGSVGASPAPADTAITDDGSSLPLADGQRRPKLSLEDWARQPLGPIQRNLFSVPYDYYPEDPAHPRKSSTTDDNQAKSNAPQADQLKERQILIQNLRAAAADLTLEGTVLGSNPRAWINGVLVGIGQPIGKSGFRVTQIESRRIFIEREGYQIELSMK